MSLVTFRRGGRLYKYFLLVLRLELGQELHQSLSALDGHGVVHAGAQAAHGLVTLQVVVAGGLGGGHHPLC